MNKQTKTKDTIKSMIKMANERNKVIQESIDFYKKWTKECYHIIMQNIIFVFMFTFLGMCNYNAHQFMSIISFVLVGATLKFIHELMMTIKQNNTNSIKWKKAVKSNNEFIEELKE